MIATNCLLASQFDNETEPRKIGEGTADNRKGDVMGAIGGDSPFGCKYFLFGKLNFPC